MPSLFKRPANLHNEGACVDIRIYPPVNVLSEYRDKSMEMPFRPCRGLIDTGASISAIDPSIAGALNLIVRNNIPVLTPSGTSHHFTYDVGFMLPSELGFKIYFIEVTGAELAQQGFDVLIGRDILQYLTLIYNGADNSFQLHL